MVNFLQIGNDKNVVYADDTTIWPTGRTVAELVEKVTAKAAKLRIGQGGRA
jgi:orotate phosphoribosyltransferase-like protein